VTNAGLFRREVSPTFHARDIFAPVAGLLAQGTPLAHVGAQIRDPVLLEVLRVTARGTAEWEGAVVHVDHFGNLITNVSESDLAGMGANSEVDAAEMVVVVEGMVLPIVRTYADVHEGEACALVTSGRLEVGVNRGSAARVLGAGRGAPVRLRAVSANG
jgi:S-adenosylmethionine hydrolase